MASLAIRAAALAGAIGLALVSVELLLYRGLCIPLARVSRKLSIAVFADSQHRNVPDPLDDPKITLRHEAVSHSPDPGASAEDFKRAHSKPRPALRPAGPLLYRKQSARDS